MAVPLTASGLPDIQSMRTDSRNQLTELLNSLKGKKDLLLDPELMKPLDRIAGASLLKQCGVDKIFKLESGKSLGNNEQKIFLVRPRLRTMKYIADQINSEKNNGDKRRYKIIYVPRSLHVCEWLLEQEGVFGDVTFDQYHLDLIPLDRDIMSMELPEFLPSFFMDSDQSWCHTVAQSLVNIQQLFGIIPNVYRLGQCATAVHKMTDLLFESSGLPRHSSPQIGHLFLVDRDMDFITPLCSQVTYEGLLNDVIGITAGLINFGEEVTGKEGNVQMLLTSQDMVYEDIRNRHFTNVSNYLSGKAKELQTGYDKRHDLSVGQMKEFVANELKDLKSQHKSLAMHVSACELITKKKTKGDFTEELRAEHNLLEGVEGKDTLSYVEEMIHRQKPPLNILRLLCLMSLTQDGLTSQMYKTMKTQFLHSHGFEHMLTFHNLKRVGLLVEKEQFQSSKPLGKVTAAVANLPKKSPFRGLSKKLALIPKSAEEVNLHNPNDMSYVFSGAYTPLSCKLIEQILLKEGFLGLEEVVKALPGPCTANIKGRSVRGGKGSSDPSSKVVLVYFLGGCTHSEITALRFIGKQRGYKFLVATTAITNATQLLQAVMDPS